MKNFNFSKDFSKIGDNVSSHLIKKCIGIFDKLGGGSIIRYIYFLTTYKMTMETMEKTTLERDIDKIKDLIENADTTLLSYKESDFDSKEAKSKLVELLNDGVKREN